MKITFTATGGAAATLVDDSVKLYGQLGDFGLESLEAVEPMFDSPVQLRYLLGNAKGPCVFTAWTSCNSYATAADYLKQEIQRQGSQGTLVMTVFGSTFTMPNATCISVFKTEWVGVLIKLRYTFGITSIT